MQGLGSFRRQSAPARSRLWVFVVLILCAILPIVGYTQTWEPTNGLDGAFTALCLFSSGSHVIAGTNNTNTANTKGVFVTSDVGKTWIAGQLPKSQVTSITHCGQYLFANAENSSSHGVLRSTDDGFSWSVIGLAQKDIFCLGNFDTVVYAFDASATKSNLFVSTDYGISWAPKGKLDSTVYCLWVEKDYVLAGAQGGVYRSSDGGQTWSRSLAIGGQQTRSLLRVGSTLLAGTGPGDGVYISHDDGVSWSASNAGLTGYLNVWDIKYLQGKIYLASDAGVFESTDLGQSWQNISNGLPPNHGVNSVTLSGSALLAAVDFDSVWKLDLPPPPTPNPAYITPDAGGPGMCVAVEIIAPDLPSTPNGYFGTGTTYAPDSLVRLVNPGDRQYVRLGPAVLSWDGKVIQQMILIDSNAITGHQVPLQVVFDGNGTASSTFNFQLVAPTPCTWHTGPPNAIPVSTVVFDSINLPSGTYTLDQNLIQHNLPIRVLSRGPITLNNVTFKIEGGAGTTNGSGGNGGPGGGGGGAGYSGVGGNGFTGGGGNNDNSVSGGAGSGGASTNFNGASSINGTPGGDGEQHTSGSFNTGPDNGGGGGTGHPFGKSGTFVTGGNSPAGGFGGGSAGGDISSHTTTYGGGGGGYGTAGTAGGGIGDNSGQAVGNPMLIPFAGGSGGGAGNCSYSSFSSSAHGGSGGGGGGAIDLTSFRSITISGTQVGIDAKGGAGSNSTGSPSSGGGGGSGGAVMLSARDSIVTQQLAAIDVSGGAGGSGGNNGGNGGRGRIRINGPLSETSNVAFFDATKDYSGPSIDVVKLTTTDFNVIGHCGLFDQPSSKPTVTVYWSWPSSTAWSTAQAAVTQDLQTHTQRFTLFGVASKNVDDTELYVVAIQGDIATNAGFTNTPSAVMSHTSGYIAKAPPKVGKLAVQQVLDFGKVRKGTCKDSSFIVANVGNGNLTITSQTFGNPQFKLISPPAGTVVKPGDTISVVLEFCPTGYGAIQSADTVHTTVGDSVVALKGYTGKGKLAAIPIIDFGRVNVGDCKYDTITVSNVGDDTLVMNGNTNFAPPFFFVGTLSGATTFTLAPGASAQIVVKYCPTDTSLSIMTALLDTIGPGEPASYQLRGHGIQSNIVLDITALDLGCRPYGSFTQDYLSIFNKGNADDKIKSITLGPPNLPITFKVRDTNLVPGIHDTVVMTINPQPGSAESGTITVVTVGGSTITMTIKMRFSPSPTITALDPVLNFDSVDVGDSATMCLRITNYSCFAIDSINGMIGAVGYGPDSAFHVLTHSNRFGSLVDSTVDTVCVQFKPIRAGLDTTLFGVAYGKTGQPKGYVKLIGIGRGVAVPVQLAIDSVFGRPGQTVNAYVRTLNDVTNAAITSVTFRVMFDPMQLDLKTAVSPLEVIETTVPNSIEPQDRPHTLSSVTQHQYSLGDREYTITYPRPLSGKAIVAALPFEILMPSASVAPVRLATATFAPATATLSTKSDGAIVIEQCDTSDRMFYNGAPLTVIQNAPNPFNPTTVVSLEIRTAGHVTMSVYNSIGQRVLVPFDADVSSGEQRVVIDGSMLASGAYRYITVWSNDAYTVRDAKTMIVTK
jgi:hypothetical protein